MTLYSAGTPVQVISATPNNAFPGLAYCSDGSLLAVWRQGSTHSAGSTGVIKMSRSTDDGATWGTVTTALSDALDLRDPMLTVLADGTVVIQLFKHNGSTGTGVYFATSPDDGATWGTLTAIPFTFSGLLGSSSPIVEPSDGTWLATGYGSPVSGGNWSARSMRSTDDGATWGDEVTIADGPTDSRVYSEPNAGILPNGHLMALVRCDTTSTIYRSVSTDDGITWGTLSTALTAGGRPAWAVLDVAVVALTRTNGSGHPNQYAVSQDNGATWSAQTQLGATPGDTGAYAQAIPLPSGDALGVLYSVQASNSSASVSYVKLSEVIVGTFADEVAADGPVWWARYDEASGTSMADDSGSTHTGTYYGSPTFGATSLLPYDGGTAVAFDGTNDRASVPDHVDLELTASGFTFLWVGNITDPAADKAQVIADKTGTSSGNGQWAVFWENRVSQGSPRRLRFIQGTSNTDWAGAAAAAAVGAGGIFHFVYGVGIYYNGTLVASGTAGGRSVNARQLDIGCVNGSTTPAFFLDGTIDEMVIYSKALSATRIGIHYAAATTAPDTVPHATAAGSFTWVGTATATAPAPSNHATAAGAFSWVGSATATAVHHASAAQGTFGWAGSAVAQATHRTSAEGTFGWAGSATASATHHATATGTFGWAALAIAHNSSRDVTVLSIGEVARPFLAPEQSRPFDITGGSMNLNAAAREFYTLAITTEPAVVAWAASFDGGSTYVDGVADGANTRWLLAGPDADPGDGTIVTSSVIPLLRAVDNPEIIVRPGPRIFLT